MTARVREWIENPAQAVEAAFAAIAQTRMADVPIVNPALRVEAVRFAPWDRHWLGILITPWCMNLMLLPREPAAWHSLPPGDKLTYRLPAGAYDFVSAREDTLGEYQSCSLFSPMFEFADHESARLTAEAAMDALFDAANAEEPALAPPPAAAPRSTLRELEARANAPLSKRDFLRGDWTARTPEAGGREPGR